MKREFENKIVIVTDGAGGLGKALALEFCGLGADVVCGDISEEAGDWIMGQSWRGAVGMCRKLHTLFLF